MNWIDKRSLEQMGSKAHTRRAVEAHYDALETVYMEKPYHEIGWNKVPVREPVVLPTHDEIFALVKRIQESEG